MKTLKIILPSVIALFLLQSCFFNGVVGNRNVTTENRNITTPFNAVSVSQGIDVIFTQEPDVTCSVALDDNLHKLLVTEVKDDILKIYFNKPVYKRKSSKVYVTAPSLNGVETSSGADFNGQNTIKTDDITLEASSGSDIDIRLRANQVTINTSSGSDITAQGTCKFVSAESSSGSDIDASELESLEGEAHASSGSDIKLYINKKLKASASSGADIYVKGHPEETDINKSSGGDVILR